MEITLLTEPIMDDRTIIGDCGIGYALNIIINCVTGGASVIAEAYQNIVYYRIIFNPNENLRCQRAIYEEIKEQNLHDKQDTMRIEDGFDKPEIKISNGSYTIQSKKLGPIYIEIDDSQIVIKVCKLPYFSSVTRDEFKEYVDEIYSKHNAASKVIIFYTAEDNKWNQPICRPPRNMDNLTMTPSMQYILNDVKQFNESRKSYDEKGYAYRRGYFLYGETGTNKSTMVEVIAYNYNMRVYLVTLNSKNMTDAILINLVSQVPPNSLVVFDEIDKQIAGLANNNSAHVTIGGLLTAIDGPQRVSEGTIIMLTANNSAFLPNGELRALLRPGRIDVVYEMI